MKIYLAGPMRHIPYYNFPAFDRVAEKLREEGHEVVSPADMDRETGFDAMNLPEDSDWGAIPDHFSLEKCIDRDLEKVKWCDAIYILPGWKNSTGALAEYHVAKWWGKRVVELSEDY